MYRFFGKFIIDSDYCVQKEKGYPKGYPRSCERVTKRSRIEVRVTKSAPSDSFDKFEFVSYTSSFDRIDVLSRVIPTTYR